MSDNDTFTAEPESLAFDVAPLGAALKRLGSTKDPILKYIAKVRTIPMGQQPVKVDGIEVARYDVLAKKPQLKSALHEAIYHVNDVDGHLVALHNWANGGATQMVGNIVPPLQSIQSILKTSGSKISAADVQRIKEQMAITATHIQIVKWALTTVTHGMERFISNLTADHDTFASGPYELHSVYIELGTQISEDARPYVLNPLSRGIGEAMLQVGRSFLASIEHLGQNLVDALAVHEAMGLAASALATACNTAFVKYEAGANAIARATPETMSATGMKLQIGTAITSWNQFAQFFSESDL